MSRLATTCELCQTSGNLQADTDIVSCVDNPNGRTTFYVKKLGLPPKLQPNSIENCPIRRLITRRSGSSR